MNGYSLQNGHLWAAIGDCISQLKDKLRPRVYSAMQEEYINLVGYYYLLLNSRLLWKQITESYKESIVNVITSVLVKC